MSVQLNPVLVGGLNPFGDLILDQTGVVSTVTGTTDETVLRSVFIPPSLLGPNSRIEIRPSFRYTNSANNKIVAVKVGTSLGGATTIFTRTRTTDNTQVPLIVHQLRGSLVAQINPYSGNSTYGTNIAANPDTATIDYSLGQTIYFTGTLANTGESIHLDAVQVKICGPGRT